jgi:MFS family permease
MYAGLFGALFLMSQLLQTALGYGPLEADLLIAPVAGMLADRYGNRPFMVLGLGLQATGYAWIAAIAHPGMSYPALGLAFTVAGIGTSFCFPTVANAVIGSVPMQEAGVASGINSALRELGGVMGVAVLASVFSHRGSYTSPHAFIGGFTPAVWVSVGLSALGIVAALLTCSRAAATTRSAAARVATEAPVVA